MKIEDLVKKGHKGHQTPSKVALSEGHQQAFKLLLSSGGNTSIFIPLKSMRSYSLGPSL